MLFLKMYFGIFGHREKNFRLQNPDFYIEKRQFSFPL